MGTPRTLKVNLSSSGYYMEIDTRKSDCNFERTPHWHLCQHGRRIGQISAYGSWASTPDVSSSIRREAESLTSSYSSEIRSIYEYNRENGADY